MKRGKRRKMQDTASHNVWRSYSDMMSGLLLLFVLIMAVCLMQAQKNYTEKLLEQAKQMQTQDELNRTQNQVDEQADQLASQQLTLEEQAARLEALQKALEEQAISLSEKESELAVSQATLDKQSSLLATQESELAASQAKLDEQTTLMAQQQEKIDQIIGVKADLIAALKDRKSVV